MLKQLSLKKVRNRVVDIIGDENYISDVKRIGHATFHQAAQQKFHIQRESNPDLVAVFFSKPENATREAAVHKYLYDLGREKVVPQFFASKIIYSDSNLILRHYSEGDLLNVLEVNDRLLSSIARLLVQFQKAPVSDFISYKFDFDELLLETRNEVPRAKKSFRTFAGCDEVFDTFNNIISRDWQSNLRNLSSGLMHGDLHPKNVVVFDGCFSLVDFSYSSYFFPLYDVASFLIQFTHEYRLSYLGKEAEIDLCVLRGKNKVFLDSYRGGDQNFDQNSFDLFKILIIFRGLKYSTAGFKVPAKSVRKHVLFELFCQEVRSFGGDHSGLV